MFRKSFYLPALTGAAAMMLLKIFDAASAFSLILAVAGITALVYSMRQADSAKEVVSLAIVMAVTYAVRFFGYTGKPAVDIVIGILIGLILFLLTGAERLLKRYEDRFWYTLIFPVLYLSFLYLADLLMVSMPFRLDVCFPCVPVLCQITAVAGIYVLDFLLAWTASALAFLIQHKASGQTGILVAVWICTLFGVVCFGTVHMNRINAEETAKTGTVRVAMAAGPYCGTLTDATYDSFTLEETLSSLDRVIQDAAEQDAEVLLFSEEAYTVSDREEGILLEEAEKMAVRNNIHVILAYEVEDTDGSEDGKSVNKLCWITGDGEIVHEYVKCCLVPFVETSEYVRGSGNAESFSVNVRGRTLRVVTAICYDADSDLFMSQMGKDVDLLFLPVWDWNAVAEAHFSVARLRAVSAGTTLVRSAYNGWNAVIDGAGNILLKENTNETGYEHVLVCDVPVR